MNKKYTFAKPCRPNWQIAVERAALIITDALAHGKDRHISEYLTNSCQNVPVKHLPQLRKDAEALLKQRELDGTLNAS